MAQIAVTILDLSNNRSAHLVETQLRTRDVIPPLVARLGLPERANYELFLVGQAQALPADSTLAASGVAAGAELQLRPVRNALLTALLDKLYAEAEGYVVAQAWEMAKAKLEELARLDPAYPDSRGLRTAVASQSAPSRSTLVSSAPLPGVPPTERVTPRRPLVTPQVASTAGPRAPSVPQTGDAYALAPQAKYGGVSCIGIGLMVVAVIVAGGLVLTGGMLFLPGLLGEFAERINFALPGGPALGTGDVQVTLRWEGEADLDLHVIDPNGEEIWFGNPESASGGILDVDANGACEGLDDPVENVYWPTNEAPTGTYTVLVTHYQTCARTEPTTYEVTITLDGNVVDVISAQVSVEGEQNQVTTFAY